MTRRGRKPRDGLEILTGYSYRADGVRFLPAGHRIASADHKRFIANRTREIWSQFMGAAGLTFEDDYEELQDLHEQAMEQAARELVELAHSKKRYLPRKPGRRVGSRSSTEKGPTDADLCRQYAITRPSIRAPGTAYNAVARVLWVRYPKYRHMLPSWHALRARMVRALRKVGQ